MFGAALSVFRDEERQYVPFVAAALFFALFVGLPLGILLAHAAAQGGTLGGRYPQVVQLHGHLQLMGWFGLFVMGMGFRLVARFTAVHVWPRWLVPLTLVLMVGGLALRSVSQPWAAGGLSSVLFGASAVFEAAAALVFTAVTLRAVRLGRPEEFRYSPFFAAGALWLSVAMLLNLAFVLDAAGHSVPTISSIRSDAVTFVQLYGFVAMFIFAVSLRTFPIFFGRQRARAPATLAAWGLANAGIAAYAAAVIWRSYDDSADTEFVTSLAFLAVGLAFLVLIAVLRIFEGTPHRLRESARRSMNFIRSAYAWLLLATAMQAYFGLRSLWNDRLPAHYETDAVRHFIALGFVTMVIIGMALLVLPRLAMRRVQAGSARVVAPLLLALMYAAAATRGAGSLLLNEAHVASGFWTMTAGGTFGLLALAVFAGYLLRSPPQPEITLPVAPGLPPSG